MSSRLSISMLPDQNKKLKKFARECHMSAATAGRIGIEFLLEVIETGTVPTGYKGTVVYALRERFKNKRGKRAPAQQGPQP